MSVKQNVRVGLIVGLAMATLYSAYAIALFLVRGSEPYRHNETTIQAVLLTYYVAGVVGGSVVGAMLPLASSWFGRLVVGVTAALIFFFCVNVATEGPFWQWSPITWQNLALCTTVFGVAGSEIWRRVVG